MVRVDSGKARGALALQCQFHGFVIAVKFLLFSETRYLLY